MFRAKIRFGKTIFRRLPGFYPAMLLLLVAVLFFAACRKDDPPAGNSGDLKFCGVWSGNTGEGLLVTFFVDTIDNRAMIKKYIVNYYQNGAKYSRIEKIESGITAIENGDFLIDLGSGDVINGMFGDKNLLSGDFLIHNKRIVFSCTNEAEQITINSISQTRFRFKKEDYLYREDQHKILMRTEEHLTFFHRKYFKSSLKLNYPFQDTLKLIKITKGRLTDIWNEDAFLQFFTPGKRNYSIGGRNGVEISIYDTINGLKKYSTSFGSGNQQGSTFEIIQTQKLENDLNEIVIVKLIARFGCMMYDMQGNAAPLTDGIYVGLFREHLQK